MHRTQKKLILEIDDRLTKETDRLSERDEGSYMPPVIEMTKKEFNAHKDNMGRKQRRKMNRGLPLYKGSRIKVIG
jgi:hypothetical protein